MNRTFTFEHRGNTFHVTFTHELHRVPLEIQFQRRSRKIRGATFALVTDQFGTRLEGASYLGMKDQFNPYVGERQALTRALALVDRELRTLIWTKYFHAAETKPETSLDILI